MIQAIIFDMDGILIDSEPLWIQAEIEVFASLGVALTPDMCERTTGLRHDEVIRYWYDRHPWPNESCDHVAARLIARVGVLMRTAPALPGAAEIISEAKARNLKLALCSSSPYVLINQVVEMLGVTETLLVHSAADEPYGKPHPAAYLTTAQKLGVDPTRCLVFEDSLNGAIAAKAARMHVIAVPQGANIGSTRFDFCDATLRSLREFDANYFQRFSLQTI